MNKENILKNAKRWAKNNQSNAPLLRYWEEYQNHEEVTFAEFKSLVLTGEKHTGNVTSITKNKKVKPAMGIATYLQLSVEKEKIYAQS